MYNEVYEKYRWQIGYGISIARQMYNAHLLPDSFLIQDEKTPVGFELFGMEVFSIIVDHNQINETICYNINDNYSFNIKSICMKAMKLIDDLYKYISKISNMEITNALEAKMAVDKLVSAELKQRFDHYNKVYIPLLPRIYKVLCIYDGTREIEGFEYDGEASYTNGSFYFDSTSECTIPLTYNLEDYPTIQQIDDLVEAFTKAEKQLY